MYSCQCLRKWIDGNWPIRIETSTALRCELTRQPLEPLPKVAKVGFSSLFTSVQASTRSEPWPYTYVVILISPTPSSPYESFWILPPVRIVVLPVNRALSIYMFWLCAPRALDYEPNEREVTAPHWSSVHPWEQMHTMGRLTFENKHRLLRVNESDCEIITAITPSDHRFIGYANAGGIFIAWCFIYFIF